MKYAVPKLITVTPALDTNAFASGDQVGPGYNLLTDAVDNYSGHVLLTSIVVIDKAKQKGALDFIFWATQPTVASSENAAFDVTDANIGDCLGYVNVAAADYIDINTNSIGTKRDINLVLKASKDGNKGNPEGKNLWFSLVGRGAYTYGAADLVIKIALLQY